MDLFFLLKRGGQQLARSVEDCRQEFGGPGLEHLLAPALLRCERLPPLPETEPAVEAEELIDFFRQQARALVRLDP